MSCEYCRDEDKNSLVKTGVELTTYAGSGTEQGLPILGVGLFNEYDSTEVDFKISYCPFCGRDLRIEKWQL